jgi:exodeoxyribonuclease VII large subunit
VVSAIGHEVDQPLLDLVADVRASTPTDAGKRVVPDVGAERAGVADARQRMVAALRSRIGREQQGLAALRARPALAEPRRRLADEAGRLAELRGRATATTRRRLAHATDDVAHLRDRVRALSPAATLERGYAVVQDRAGRVVREPSQVTGGDKLRLRLAGGDLSATADSTG